MTEQELKEIWMNSSQMERIQVDLSRLVMDLKNKLNRIEKVIRKRDIREIVAAFIGIPIFAYFAFVIPYPITKVASALTVAWSVYVIYRFRKLQLSKRNENLELPFMAQLENQKANMMAQHRFLDTVLYWYAGPPFVLNSMFILGLGDPKTMGSGLADHLPFESGSQVTLIVILAFFYGFVVWLNKRAIKKTLNPLIADIQRIQDELEAKE